MTRTRKIVLIVVGVVVLLVVAVGIWLVSASQSPAGEATPSPSSSVPPTPSVFPTPTPGSTTAAPTEETTVEAEIGDVATVIDGVTVEVVSMTSFDSTSEQPGDLAGPALTVVVRVNNATDAAIDLAGAAVNLASGEKSSPAPPLGDTVTDGLPSAVGAGESAEGSYSFSLPLDARGDVTITLDLLTGEPYVAFRGAAPAS